MITIEYDGFFQCRLATDSAAYDAPRGVGGWTFAFGNEPDLDRIIRLHDPVALRSQAPPINVSATSVVASCGLEVSSLDDARIDFLDGAVFEGRNGVIAGDAVEPISPIKMEIKTDLVRLERGSDYDVESAIQRSPYMGGGIISLPDVTVRGTSISNPSEALSFRANRKSILETELAGETDSDVREILESRIQELDSGGGPITGTLASAVPYSFTLKDSPTIDLPAGSPLEGHIDIATAWNVEFWMGCFDADTLTGFMRGKIEIPTI